MSTQLNKKLRNKSVNVYPDAPSDAYNCYESYFICMGTFATFNDNVFSSSCISKSSSPIWSCKSWKF